MGRLRVALLAFDGFKDDRDYALKTLKAAVAGGLVAGFGWWAWTSALQSDERRWMLELASGWKRNQ